MILIVDTHDLKSMYIIFLNVIIRNYYYSVKHLPQIPLYMYFF